MSPHARKHDGVGCEKQMSKTVSERPSLIRAFVILSLLNSIAKEARPEISVAQSPSHRSEIAELFIRDAATLMLPVRFSRFGYALYALATTSL